jgi:hypothetical protein
MLLRPPGKAQILIPRISYSPYWNHESPGNSHRSPLAAIMPARAYVPHRIAFYLFVLAKEFRALWTLRHIYALAVRLHSLALPLKARKPQKGSTPSEGLAQHERLKTGRTLWLKVIIVRTAIRPQLAARQRRSAINRTTRLLDWR